MLVISTSCMYFQLHEIEWEGSGLLLHDRRCDVACFLYDVTDPLSFAQVVELREVCVGLLLRGIMKNI